MAKGGNGLNHPGSSRVSPFVKIILHRFVLPAFHIINANARTAMSRFLGTFTRTSSRSEEEAPTRVVANTVRRSLQPVINDDNFHPAVINPGEFTGDANITASTNPGQ